MEQAMTDKTVLRYRRQYTTNELLRLACRMLEADRDLHGASWLADNLTLAVIRDRVDNPLRGPSGTLQR
jgi:hypothetical protein